MQFEELDEDMQQIIMECQEDFIRDGHERFAKIREQIGLWQQSAISGAVLADYCQQQVHSMKGVARTIYFHTFHELSEQIGENVRNRDAHNWPESAVNDLVRMMDGLQKQFNECESVVRNR